MVRVAICDDEKEIVILHEEIIQNVLKSFGSKFEISTYTHSDNLLYDIIEDGFFYDVLLLDIEMPEVTGMEIAEKIKPYLPNIKIIFITSHVEYAIDAFELSIFRYVPKEDIEKRLPAAIRDAAKLIELEDDKVYTIQTKSRLEKIPYKEIYYIAREGKDELVGVEFDDAWGYHFEKFLNICFFRLLLHTAAEKLFVVLKNFTAVEAQHFDLGDSFQNRHQGINSCADAFLRQNGDVARFYHKIYQLAVVVSL
nr:LytTR family DNA-binding domain-containing protein [Clostridium oryzae]